MRGKTYLCYLFGANLPLKAVPPWLMKPLLGGPLVDALVTSARVRNDKAKAELGWAPRHPSFGEGVPGVLRDMGLLPAG